jgi:hypothetical protein
MSEGSNPRRQERQELRRQLRAVGWKVVEFETMDQGQVRLQVRPDSPGAGIEPRWVEGTDRVDALRNAVREVSAPPPAEEP